VDGLVCPKGSSTWHLIQHNGQGLDHSIASKLFSMKRTSPKDFTIP
jgi:hypothetical protein